MVERFLSAWCRLTHDAAMWPMHGRYTCARCLRQHPVSWEARQPLVMPARRPRPVPVASASMDICA